MKEIEERFSKIKNHKPKASKKLNELGDILASAYKIYPERADEMWQYIVDLNVRDNSANAKFYIAQVFNKLIDRLPPEEATELITMTSERVQLMVMYGYEGGTLWRCMDTLICGYFKLNASDNALVCVGFFYDKFGGINSGSPEIVNVTRNATRICIELIQANENVAKARGFLHELASSENEEINLLVKLFMAVKGIKDVDNFDLLFAIAIEYKCSVEFFDLLWMAKDHYSQEDLRGKWIEYVENCDENDIRPYNYLYNDEEDYSISKSKFYIDIEKDAEALLDYYFGCFNIYDLEIGIIWTWVEEEKWELFIKYVSLVVMNTSEQSFGRSAIKRCIETYMESCFFDEYRDSTDRFGRSYKKLMQSRKKAFSTALSKISMISVGCDCHDSYHAFVKEYIQKLNGNLDVLNELGFEENVENRSAEERLKDYVHDFLMSGTLVHSQNSNQYSIITKALREEVYRQQGGNHFTVYVNINSPLQVQGDGISSLSDEPKEEADESLEQAYRLALDDEIAEFYFAHFPSECTKRTELLAACIQKNDVNRAIELIDIMARTKGNPGYEELNGWGRQNMLTIKYLIKKFDFTNKDRWDAKDITDEMRQVAKQLVYQMIPYLSETGKKEIKEDLYRINPDADDSEEYIAQLLADAKVYSTFPKPSGKGSVPNINHMSGKFRQCFERLSKMGRLDIVEQIMTKFSSVKDILGPVTYDTWISFMARGLTAEDLLKVYRNNSEIFESWLEMDEVQVGDIRLVADKLSEKCTRKEYITFRNIVISQKGYIQGLDYWYTATSENTETQLLFNGKYAKIELDFLDITCYDHINSLELNFLTKKKRAKFESVRVSYCRINGLPAELNSYETFDEGDFSVGYRIYDKNSEDELGLYSDFFDATNIHQIDVIELGLVIADSRGKILETVPDIKILHDMYTGEYKVKDN